MALSLGDTVFGVFIFIEHSLWNYFCICGALFQEAQCIQGHNI